ncbi:uncharacterized protein JCM6883_003507 [Sporobolomyces salmoneus]|uniref:uncharacterized protein n=1 Tax=Sporobolomyces salmoneus TaxID=183962 RepID=UPI003178B3E3
MSRPINLTESNISPLFLSTSAALSSSSSPLSTFSHLSLGENDDDASTLVDSTDSEDRNDEDDSASSIDSCTDPTCCPPPPASSTTKSSSPSSPVVVVSEIIPLVIAGAGPHSLALAARLSEPCPAALYTDLEHARLSWLQREEEEGKGRRKRKTVKGHWGARKIVPPEKVTLATTGSEQKEEAEHSQTIRVLDSTSDRWLGRWNNYFKGLEIKTLRSPMLFHPSPADVDALVAYARKVGREDELVEINGVVGKELSKHQQKKKRGRPQKVNGTVPINERDRQDYFRPSSRLFESFIHDELISRYSLDNLVTHSTVFSIEYRLVQVEGDSEEPREAFVITSRNPVDGSISVIASKAAVVAPGPSNRPMVPPVIKRALPPSTIRDQEKHDMAKNPWDENEIKGEGWCHSSAFALPEFSPFESVLGQRVRRRERTTALVIGGGLTSVQIVESLLSRGVDKVVLVCRSHIKVKHFDFPLAWVSKYNNLLKAQFWNAPTHEERLDLIRQARDGGSVNPDFYKRLNRYVKSGQVELKTLSTVTDANYSVEAKKWSIRGETKTRTTEDEVVTSSTADWEVEGIDYVVCSTGSQLSLDSLPFLNSIRRDYPIEEVGGLPCVTEDLQWRKDLPLFVMGAFSMLELGPDALNLSGTRTGAERVGHRLGELGIFATFKRDRVGQENDERTQQDSASMGSTTRMEAKRYRSGGEGNFFRGLSVGIEA